jgi:hypothetical protein
MLVAALVIAGWIAAYLSLQEMLQRKSEKERRQLQDQIDVLAAKLQVLVGPAQPKALASGQVARKEESLPAVGSAETIPSTTVRAPAAPAEVTPETMAVIAETVAGHLGKSARIRSAKKLPTPPSQSEPPSSMSADPWVQQGRVLLQTSHEPIHARTSGAPGRPAPASLRGVVLENTDLN